VYPRPDADGQEQLSLLGAAWEKTAQHWQDGVARQFETDQWAPITERSRAYLEALRNLLDLLEAAERETEF
jgi:hypothetical protein